MVAVIALAVTLMAQGQAPPGRPSEQERLPARLSGEFTPLAKPDVANGPVPRMPDGRPDLSGPWVGGGSNQDIERDGGLKPGELPLLPWAKQLRDSRKEEDEPLVFPKTPSQLTIYELIENQRNRRLAALADD